MAKVVLASASPRRKELFGVITHDFDIIPSDVVESVPSGIRPIKQAEYLSALKAGDISEKYPQNIVIGADTCVVAENQVLGKPKNKEDAKKMLRLLSGKIHFVVTGCTICKGKRAVSFSNITEVEFYELTDKEIEDYINTSEPYDKAGAYAIQGMAGLFVKKINGDYYNVVGLPISQLKREIMKFDV